MFKFNKLSGQASKLLLVLAVVVLVAVIIVYLIMRMAEKPPKENIDTTPAEKLPVYETQLSDIRFIFESAINRGGVLRAADIKNSQYKSSYQKDLVISNTGAKFIQVTVGAQNKGTENTVQGAWGIENIIDSEGRKFVPLESYAINPWLPEINLCGALLKPAFDPTPCTKIYEVSKESTGLKIVVEAGQDNNSISSNNVDSFLLDLIVK